MKIEVMEKPKVKPIFYFGLAVMTASFSKVLSVPALPTIMEQMNNDRNICPMAKLLSNSTFARDCTDLRYIEGELELNMTTVKIFLCLEVYDAAYKFCQHMPRCQNQLIFNVEEFDKELKKFIPDDRANSTEMFCKSLTGLSPSYSKLREPLLKLAQAFNRNDMCPVVCFDIINHKFSNPLCALVLWINRIDHNSTILTLNDNMLQCKESQKSASKSLSLNLISAETPMTDHKNKHTTNQTVNVTNGVSTNSNHVESSTKIVEILEKFSNEETNNKEKSVTQTKIESLSISTTLKIGNDGDKGQVNAQESLPAQLNEVELPEAKENDATEIRKIGNKKGEVKSDHLKIIKNDEDANQSYSNHLEDDQDHYDQDVVEPPMDAEGNKNQPEVQPRYPSIKSDEDSHFFTYFTIISVIGIAGYIGYHNKQKILAILLEGRRSRGSRNRRRLSTASYRKLDCTLEEAVTSQCNVNVTHVIY